VRRFLAALLAACPAAFAQDSVDSRELIGQLGGRTAVLQLHENPRADGSVRLSGEYLILPALQRRFLEGERSRQLGVTFLQEGNSPILSGRPATATLQGTWTEGAFKGARYAPGGQERERFEFSENFPDMQAYSAEVRCELEEGRYASSLHFAVAAGKLQQLDWRSRISPGGHSCGVTQPVQQSFEGGLRFVAGRCRVTLRDLGEYVRVSAENCAEFCGSQAYFEPVLVDRRGGCQLLRPQSR
jgi:hypothetical protein